MPNNRKKRRKRSRRRPKKSNLSFSSLPVQLASVLIVVFLIFFLIAAKVISNMVGAFLCMVSLSILSYFIVNSPKKSRKRRRPKKRMQDKEEPQFYTALPSTLGVTEIPEDFSKSETKLPPRPASSARRQREFIMYPTSVGGGDYSDSYIQIDKDRVLRLRGEMIPEMGTRILSGNRISSLPSVDDIINLLENSGQVSAPIAAEPVAIAAEPVAIAAEPVVVAATEPVVVAATEPVSTAESSKNDESEEEDMDFDMEWD